MEKQQLSTKNAVPEIFSQRALEMAANPIRRVMLKAENRNDILKLSGGAPRPSLFPIGTDLIAKLRLPKNDFAEVAATISKDLPGNEVEEMSSVESVESVEGKVGDKEAMKNKEKKGGRYFPIVGKSKSPKKELNKDEKPEEVKVAQVETGEKTVEVKLDMMLAMNYNQVTYSQGLPLLRQWIIENIIKKEFPGLKKNPNFWSEYDVCLNSGATDALAKCVDLLVDQDDVIFAEEYCYPGIMTCGKKRVVPVKMDDEGMSAVALEAACKLVLSKGKSLKPKLVYIVPTGHNPTTITMSNKRREELYNVCCKYNLALIVDDAYYYLKLGNDATEYRSFLEMDTEGRVIRLDTISKIIAPGFRTGWVTARKEFTDKFAVLTQTTSWGMAGLNQTVLYELFNAMGVDGFNKQVEVVREAYTCRRDAMVAALEKHLVDDHGNKLATWAIPTHGMFLWMKVPRIRDTKVLVEALMEEKVSLVPGSCFSPIEADSNAFRLSYSYVTRAEMDEAARKIAVVLKNLDKYLSFEDKSCNSAESEAKAIANVLAVPTGTGKFETVVVALGIASAFITGMATASLISKHSSK